MESNKGTVISFGHFEVSNSKFCSSRVYLSTLQSSIKDASLAQGKYIHGHMSKNSNLTNPSIFCWNALVNMYIRNQSVNDAWKLFVTLSEKDSFTWTTMIGGFNKSGHEERGLFLFQIMKQEGVNPDKVTFSCVLLACKSAKLLEIGKYVHAEIIRASCDSDAFVKSSLINMYANCGSIGDACKVFNGVLIKDVILWSSMITGYILHENAEEAIALFLQMLHNSMKPDEVLVMSIINASAILGNMAKAKQFHVYVLKIEMGMNISIQNSLIDMYNKSGSLGEAWKVFYRIPVWDLISWNVMIAGCSNHKEGKMAFDLFYVMQTVFMKPDSFTFVSILKACAILESLEHGKYFHAFTIIVGYQCDTFVNNALIDMYVRSQRLQEAEKLFNRMFEQDIVSWNAMIAGYAQHDDGEMFNAFSKMQSNGVMATEVTFVSALSSCTCFPQGKKLHSQAVKAGFELDVFVGNTIIDMYIKCGSLIHACEVFDRMLIRNVVSWTAMVGVCVQHGYVVKLFWQMEKEGIKPDNITFVDALRASTGIAALDDGRHIHDCMIQMGGMFDIAMGNALVDLYAKCGCIQDACTVFMNMPVHNLVSWNTMISGQVHYGNGIEAVKLFKKMHAEGVLPDSVTLILVVMACSHDGLVNEGYHYLLMSQEYEITLTEQHYSCVIDLLGRGGWLDEANQFFDLVPFQTSTIIQMAYLGACKLHCNRRGLADQVIASLSGNMR